MAQLAGALCALALACNPVAVAVLLGTGIAVLGAQVAAERSAAHRRRR